MEALLVWGLVLLALALVIVIIDLFLPTAGILAALAIVLAVAGVVCLFRYDTTWGVIGSLLVIVGGPALFVVGFKMMPHTPVGRRLILGASDDEPRPPAPPSPLERLVGSEAMVVTDLRPVGTVRVGDRKFDAISETTLIRAGSTVRITAVDGLNLKVRPV
ncbi:MAG TPA: NfeD family protein [Phycisphaerales bacterium]|nr:NfeD family protein [Phycisphaerales bacterium]